MPNVRAPGTAKIRVPVEVKLKSSHRYDSSKRMFEAASGARFNPSRDLPKGTKIVHKVPALAAADRAKLSKWEKELGRRLQVILPYGVSAHDYVDVIRNWPSVEDAWIGPEVSLPSAN